MAGVGEVRGGGRERERERERERARERNEERREESERERSRVKSRHSFSGQQSNSSYLLLLQSQCQSTVTNHYKNTTPHILWNNIISHYCGNIMYRYVLK